MLETRAGRGLPLRPGLARRGDAAARPGRGPDPHRPHVRASGRAAASTTSPAACAAASACAPRVVTAFADNEVGRLRRGPRSSPAASTPRCPWVPYDGIGRTVRNGLNFTERGFGVRGAVGVSDRGHTAAGSCARRRRLGPPVRHAAACAGSTPAASSPPVRARTPDVVEAAMAAARRHGTVVSYDLNYRPSLWKAIGGQARAQEVNRRLAGYVDVMIGNEEDFTAASASRCRARRREPADLADGELRGDDRHGRRQTYAELQGRRDHAAHRALGHRQRLGRGRLVAGTGFAQRHAPRPAWRSSTGSAAATASRPGLIYGLLAGRRLHDRRRVRRRPRRARDDHARRHLHGDPRRGATRSPRGGGARVRR